MITGLLHKVYGELENRETSYKPVYTLEVGGGIKIPTLIDPWGNAVGLIEGA